MLSFLLNKVYAVQGSGVGVAGGGVTNYTNITNPLATGSISDLINNITNYLVVYIAPSIVTLMILWGAFRMLTAAGDPEKFATGRKTVIYAVAGYVVVLLAAGITKVVIPLLNVK